MTKADIAARIAEKLSMTITARGILSYHPSVVLKNRINGINKAA